MLLHGKPRRDSHLNLSNKKRNLRKYSVVFFKAFSKKRYLVDPVFDIANYSMLVNDILRSIIPNGTKFWLCIAANKRL